MAIKLTGQPNALFGGYGEDYFNQLGQTGPSLYGFGTPTGIGNPQQAQAYGYDDPYAMVGLGDSKFNPTVRAQLSGMGISELPAWMQHYTSANYDQTNIAQALQSALGINPAAWLGTDGKMQNAMHGAGVYKFSGDKAYDLFGNEVAWDDATKAAAQQAYLNRFLKENRGGFNMLGQEGLGMASVLLPMAVVGGAALGAGGAGAAAGGGVGGGAGAGVGAGVPTTAAELGAMGGGWGAGIGGGTGLGIGGGTAVSGFGGLSGPELVAGMGGGSGVAPAGGGSMGFLDSLGSLFGSGTGTTGGLTNSSIWPTLIQGGLGALGSYMGGEAQKDAADKSADVLWAMYNQNRADMSPLMSLLGQYAPQFSEVASAGGMDYTNDPMYQADKAEMMRTLNRGQASVGKLRSSDTDNAITRNLSTLMNTAYARKYGGLLDLLKLGSGAASSAGASGQNTGNALAGVYGNAGNAQANMYSGMFGSGMGALNNWQLMNLLASMRR